MASHFSEVDPFNMPPEFKPLGAWAYIGLSILFDIPILGWIFLIVFSFSDGNINRRNYARSYLIVLLLTIIACLVLIFTGNMSIILDNARNFDWESVNNVLPF